MPPMSDAENRWMPPSPHRERILHEIAIGAAHIVERGHNVPPLLVFEDGGMFELPRVRLEETRRGLQLIVSDETPTAGQTRFYDVCSTVDEILGQVREKRLLDPAEMGKLLDDIRYMIGRMARRSQQYVAFFEAVHTLSESALELARPDADLAEARLAAFRASLESLGSNPDGDGDTVVRSAEHARALAQALEDYLAQCKLAAMRINRAFLDVRGGREWPDSGTAE